MDPQIVPPPPQSAETNPTIPQKILSLPLIIGGLFLILLIGVGAFYLGKRQSTLPPSSTLTPTTSTLLTPTLIPTTAQDETANWKTYVNKPTGLTFSYPPTYSQIRDGVNQQDSTCNYIEFSSNSNVDSSQLPTELSLSINICPTKPNDSLDTFYQEQLNSGTKIMNKTTTVLNNRPVVRYQWQNITGHGNGETILIIMNNKRVAVYKYPLQTSRQQEFEKILSTFKFLDQPSLKQKNITTYTACGCGCCGGTTPTNKCIYHSKGDNLDTIIQEDKKVKESPQCSTMGCSKGIEYSYCD